MLYLIGIHPRNNMKWMNVNDKLPDRSLNFIICLINDKPILCEVHDATFCLIEGRVSFYWPSNKWVKDEYYSNVTHWMPLPEPPKE